MQEITSNDLLLGLLSIILGYTAWFLKRIAINVEKLNETMGIVLTRLSTKEKVIDDHEIRIRDIERKRICD